MVEQIYASQRSLWSFKHNRQWDSRDDSYGFKRQPPLFRCGTLLHVALSFIFTLQDSRGNSHRFNIWSSLFRYDALFHTTISSSSIFKWWYSKDGSHGFKAHFLNGILFHVVLSSLSTYIPFGVTKLPLQALITLTRK